MGLNQGSRGLLQRVNPYLHMADGAVFELTQTEDDRPWAETLDALGTAEQVLAKMLELLNGDGASPTNFEDDEDEEIAGSITSGSEAPPSVYNIRIKSRRILRDADVPKDDDSYFAEKDPKLGFTPGKFYPDHRLHTSSRLTKT
jgi:hypothetical protein